MHCVLHNKFPSLSIHKSGVLRLNKTAVTALDFKHGDAFEVLQDEENPQDWYIAKTTNENALIWRKDSSGAMLCNVKYIADKILKSLGITGKAAKFRIATEEVEEGLKAYAIFTHSANK